jgi:hypothetical protein
MPEKFAIQYRERTSPLHDLTRRDLLKNAVKTGFVMTMGSGPLASALDAVGEAAPIAASDLAKPWVYWFWLNGNINPAGITADLEAMASIGVGGAIVFSSRVGDEGAYLFSTPEWFDIVKHTVREASRLGMRVDFNNADGWADASGPWVPIQNSMQKITWSETRVTGGVAFSGKLDQPHSTLDFYLDAAVVAIPAPLGSDTKIPKPSMRALPGAPSAIVHDYGTPITARSAMVQLWASAETPILTPILWSIEASDDGIHFRTIYNFDNHWRFCDMQVQRVLRLDCRFSVTTARWFRLTLPFTQTPERKSSNGEPANPEHGNFFELSAEDRMPQWHMKAGYLDGSGASIEQPSRYKGAFRNLYTEFGSPAPVAEAKSIIAPDDVVDLSSHFHDEMLEWEPPAGEWIVLRLGHTTTGRKNPHATKTGSGFYVDMFNAEAMDDHFNHVVKRVLEQNAPMAGKALAAFHMDSSECGPQNWSAALPTEFEKRRGYSLAPWIPVLLGGRVVGSVEQSERFLWDFRRTMADLMGENWWGRLGDLCRQNGVKFSGEGAGRMAYLLDPILYLSKADYPMGEFWIGEMDVRPDCPLSRSAANTYGKEAVFGESFTSASWTNYSGAGAWQDHPYSLKKLGDRAFVAGVNHMTLHRSVAQPDNSEPGLALPHIGINMERKNTWWKPGGSAWVNYLTRCQGFLQSGREVVDICVLMNEDVPNYLLSPDSLPPGYRYDGLHFELLPKMTVKRGEIVLASGMRYRVLVLPDTATMRPETLRQIARLVREGAMIAGALPQASPSLTSYPACDAEVRKLVAELRGKPNVQANVAEALRFLSLRPDFSHDSDCEIGMMHRRRQDGEFYFLSNQTDAQQTFLASFRISGPAPELMDPDSGELRPTALYNVAAGLTSLPLTLMPRESVFVFFRGPSSESVAMVARNAGPVNAPINSLGLDLDGIEIVRRGNSLELTTALSGELSVESATSKSAKIMLEQLPVQEITGPWKLDFPQGWGARASVSLANLISWPEHPDQGVRYFSGSGAYAVFFNLSQEMLVAGQAVFLDLGEVGVVAETILNGQPIGTRWKPPFRYEVTKHLVMGRNELKVTVTNLWVNRLIGDSSLQSEQRYTQTNYNPYQPTDMLLPSGLIGPVRLVAVHRKLLHLA